MRISGQSLLHKDSNEPPAVNLIDIDQLSEHIPLSVRTLQDMYRTKGMPCIRIGGRVLFNLTRVVKWLEEKHGRNY